MFRIMRFFILMFILAVVFVSPLRRYLNTFFHKNIDQPSEEEIIGMVSGYNPRVEEIQEILKEVYLDPGPVDGVMGSQTRRAIKDFQKERGFSPSGKVDAKTWLELNKEKENLKKEISVEPLAFPKGYPVDIKSEEEIAKIRGPQEQAVMGWLPGDKNKQIQIALEKAGFYHGKIDGKIGPQTKEAIKAFQRSKGLEADGIVGAKTWAELKEYLKE